MVDLPQMQQKFEADCLKSSKACTYMAARGITPEMRLWWGLGYCKDWYEDDFKSLHKRLTFPIYDWRGRLLSFAGRTLKSGYSGAKYIGLSDSDLFKKSQQVYGLNYAMPHIAKSRVVLVVEGYTDVLGVSDYSGVKNVVGSMGVALTMRQVLLLSRWAKLIIVVLDGDAAGARATERLQTKLADSPIEIKYVSLPIDCDPFDMSKEMGLSFALWLKANVSGQMRFHVSGKATA